MDYPDQLREAIRNGAREKELSLSRAARLAGVKPNTLIAFMNRQTEMMSADRVSKVGNALGISLLTEVKTNDARDRPNQRTPWECPRCHVINAPWQGQCTCKPEG